jgi:hypothetical protein
LVNGLDNDAESTTTEDVKLSRRVEPIFEQKCPASGVDVEGHAAPVLAPLATCVGRASRDALATQQQFISRRRAQQRKRILFSLMLLAFISRQKRRDRKTPVLEIFHRSPTSAFRIKDVERVASRTRSLNVVQFILITIMLSLRERTRRKRELCITSLNYGHEDGQFFFSASSSDKLEIVSVLS